MNPFIFHISKNYGILQIMCILCITSVNPCCSQHFEHIIYQVSFSTRAPESHRTTLFFSVKKT